VSGKLEEPNTAIPSLPPRAGQKPTRRLHRRSRQDRRQNDERQLSQKKIAGKLSARIRKERALLRQRVVAVVYDRLKPAYRNQPYSTDTIGVVQDEYLRVLHQKPNNVLDVGLLKLAGQTDRDARDEVRFRFYLSLFLEMPKLSDANREILSRVSDETLIKDFKQLGVRSRYRQKRFG
jgi:hypothetical protein